MGLIKKGITQEEAMRDIPAGPYNPVVTTSTGIAAKVSYDDRNEGAREGNRRNVAAMIVQGLVMANGWNIEKALKAYDEIHAHLVKKDSGEGQ